MDEYIKISSPEVLFVADAHFRDRRLPGEAERRRRFVRFLSEVRPEAALMLLGDIFDFYIEYGSVVPNRFFDIFHALSDCHQRGVALHFVGGNHDYWAGSFLENEIGIELHEDEILVESQGRKIRCCHGDLIMPGDRGYHALRAFIRNPLLVRAAKWLHPDVLDAIASAFSTQSKKRSRDSQEDMAQRVIRDTSASCFAKGNDAFIMGHVHFPLHHVEEGREFMILGDWIEHFTYARLRDGKLTLEKAEY